jgi:histone-lysine N-methyltransferase SETD3
MDALRTRLAPIRGIPTKGGGMVDPNQDLKEIFDFIEQLPATPKRFVDGLVSWARGDQDPNWGKQQRGKATPPASKPPRDLR